MIALAAEKAHVEAAQSIVSKIEEVLIFPIVTLLMSVALLVFFFGVFEYIRNADDSGAQEQGRRHMIWGIAGFVVMVSAYAMLKIATATLGIVL